MREKLWESLGAVFLRTRDFGSLCPGSNPGRVAFYNRLKKRSLSNTTINHHVRTAKAVLNDTVHTALLPKNSWRKLELLVVKRARKRHTVAAHPLLLLFAIAGCRPRGKLW